MQFRYDESLPEVDLDCRTTLDYVLQMEEVQELSLIFFCFSFYKIESFNAQCGNILPAFVISQSRSGAVSYGVIKSQVISALLRLARSCMHSR